MSTVVTRSEGTYNLPGISFRTDELSKSVLRKSYRIVLEKDEDGRVVVRSPDLQGVVTDGADEKEAIKNAFEAVNAILETRGLSKEYNLTLTHKLSA